MTFNQWLRKVFGPRVEVSRASRRGKSRQPSRHRCVPRVEFLEDRLAPATLMVNSLLDNTTSGDGLVTLREAITAADNDTITDLGQTGSGADVIRFSSAINGGTISLSMTPINDQFVPGPTAFRITSTLVIDGETDLTQGITIERSSSAAPFRLFFVNGVGDLTLQGLTLRGGVALGFSSNSEVAGGTGGTAGGGSAGLGGAIFNQGSLTLRNSTLTGNTAQGGPGGSFGYTGSGSGGGGLGGPGGAHDFRTSDGGAGGGPNGGAGGSFDDLDGRPASGFGGGGGGFGGAASGIVPFTGTGGFGGFGGGGGGGGSANINTGGWVGDDGGFGGFGGGGGGGGGWSETNCCSGGLAGIGGFGGGNGYHGSAGGGAGMGGAIFNRAGTVVITNSTVTGNTATGGAGGSGSSLGYKARARQGGYDGSGLGGGVFNYNGGITVTNSTLSSNTAAQGGRGIFNLRNGLTAATAVINNTIIAQSDISVSDLRIQVINSSVIDSNAVQGSANLIRTILGANSLTGTVTGDPQLGPLQNNGGPTQTMALLAGSPAINAGTAAAAPTTDQRGFTRIGTADIGAFEFGGVAPTQPQTITFGPLANRNYGDADFAISATATSGLPVSFTSSDNAIASVQNVGGVWYVHINKAGSVTITAMQAGNASYDPATDVARVLTIAKAASVTTTVGAGPFTYNGSAQIGGSGTVTGAGGLNTSATSLTYSANSDGTGVADRTNAGTYYVTAHYAGDANHTASDGVAVAIVITKADATVTVSGYTGVYDAAFHGATGSESGVGGEDAGTLTLGASIKDVPGGTAHWVFTGNGNYKDQSGNVDIEILALHITGGFTAADKIYNGNDSATVLTRSLSGVLGSDDVSLAGGTATFGDKKVGTDKFVTLAGATLSGGDAGNYVLDSVATTTASISALHITGTFTAADKVYDNSTAATVLSRSLVGAISGDALSLTGGTAAFANKNAGTWTVTLAGATLGGGDAGNYVLDSVATTTAKITPKALTAASATTQSALNVAKDGTVSFRIDLNQSGIVDGQSVAQLFNGASFRLTVGGQTYSVQARAVVVDGIITVSFRMSDELKAILAANTTATSASNAPAVGLKLEAMSNDGNYKLDVLASTRLFNTAT